MTFKEALHFVTNQLKNKYDEREAQASARILLEDCLLYTPGKTNDQIEAHDWQAFLDRKLPRALHGEPIQYITGIADFYGYQLAVNDNVLIPRSETEELVAWVLGENPSLGIERKVLDIGTGSGCIALTLQRRRNEWKCIAIDEDKKALEVALQNEATWKTNCQFQQIDFLDKNQWSDIGRMDIIVSNPPYISDNERELIQDNTLQYEPAKALFPAHEDPLIFYRYIVEFAASYLNKGGRIYVEINEFLASETLHIFESAAHLHDIELRKDLQTKPRMLRAIKSE